MQQTVQQFVPRALADWVRRVRLREWWFSVLWLGGLANGIEHTRRAYPSFAMRAAVLTGTAVYAAVFVATFALAAAPGRMRLRYTLAGVSCAFALLYTGLLGQQWMPLYIYVALSCSLTLPLKQALGAVGGLVVAGLVLSVARGYTVGEYAWILLAAAVAGLFSAFGIERRRIKDRLQQGERAMAQLAVNEERLRFARDLHDLLGHSLSLMALKAQLAGRLLRTDPDACARQIAEMEEISRQALAEVRDSVTGYRRPTLAVELARARTALGTAGIELHADPALEARAAGLEAAREAALAWALRESVTNVLRHAAGARSCEVRLRRSGGEFVLEVQDDGKGSPSVPGNGLTGLRERLTLEGGRLESGPAGSGYRVRAYVPAPAGGSPAGLDQPATDLPGHRSPGSATAR